MHDTLELRAWYFPQHQRTAESRRYNTGNSTTVSSIYVDIFSIPMTLQMFFNVVLYAQLVFAVEPAEGAMQPHKGNTMQQFKVCRMNALLTKARLTLCDFGHNMVV